MAELRMEAWGTGYKAGLKGEPQVWPGHWSKQDVDEYYRGHCEGTAARKRLKLPTTPMPAVRFMEKGGELTYEDGLFPHEREATLAAGIHGTNPDFVVQDNFVIQDNRLFETYHEVYPIDVHVQAEAEFDEDEPLNAAKGIIYAVAATILLAIVGAWVWWWLSVPAAP
jgi:hypothetical protein